MISAYLIDIIIMLMAAVVVVPLLQSVRLGAVPGFLIAGVIVGPSGFGLINNITEIGHLAEIGVVLLLFVIGIELKPSTFWRIRRLVFGLGGLQVLFTGVLLSGIMILLFDVSPRSAILIGPALALSSTAFVLQLLAQKQQLTAIYGRTSVAVLLFQDLAVVPLLALLPLLAMPELSIGEDLGYALLKTLFILGLVVLVGRYFFHPILHRVALSGNPEVFTASAVLIVLGASLATEHIGLSMGMGAFLAGLLISDSFYKHQVMAEIRPFRGLLLGLFFMSMGMSLNLNLLLERPVLSLSLVIALMVIKALVLFPMAYLFGLKVRNSLAVAIVLAQSGEFALVIFALAHQSNLLSEGLYQQLLLTVLLSMLATPSLVTLAQYLVKTKLTATKEPAEKPVKSRVVIAGFGRVGRRVGEILSAAGEDFVALDCDARIVNAEREHGHPVFFGDVRKPELLKAVGAADAKVIIVTINDSEASQQIVTSLRKDHPKTSIYVRGHSLNQCCELRRLGASDVVSENVEASLELARMALVNVGVSKLQQDKILKDYRVSYHAKIEKALGLGRRGK